MKKNTLMLPGLCAAMILFAGQSHAQAQQLKPGQYEYATQTQAFGMNIPMTFKQCVTQKDVDTNSAYVNQQGVEGCTPPEVKRNGSNIQIRYSCSKPKMTGEGSGTVSDEKFTMDMKVTQHEMNNSVVQTSLVARRIGNCSP